MKLTVLVDNSTKIDHYLLGEPALSFYIEEEGQRFLFDAGYSDAFLKNTATLGIDLNGLDRVILSHGHNDHAEGLQYLAEAVDLSETTLLAHPDVMKPKFFEGHSISPSFPIASIPFKEIQFSKDPVWLSDKLVYLGEIQPLITPRKPAGDHHHEGQLKPDYLLDDTALAYKGSEGIFILTGCSHSGIENIIEYAKQVCGDERIAGVIGGFHLFKVNPALEEVIHYFQKNQIHHLYPCHCVSFPVKAKIHRHIPIREVFSGMRLEFV